jgi:hypothetical protein
MAFVSLEKTNRDEILTEAAEITEKSLTISVSPVGSCEEVSGVEGRIKERRNQSKSPACKRCSDRMNIYFKLS